MGHLILISNLIWDSFKQESNREYLEEIYKDGKLKVIFVFFNNDKPVSS